MATEPQPSTLYIVGTPIGNLEDMTFRGIKILQGVDLIAAEDTRHTGKLLQHFQIKTPQISHHEHNLNSRIPELIQKLQSGMAIALVTDAGMPGISDPGYELITSCIQEKIPVVPIPGATAAITALSAGGLPTDKFIFEGFLPAKSKARREHLAKLHTEHRTLIFYESPHRLRDTLQDFADIFGQQRQIVLARELTKLHEEFWRGTIAAAIQEWSDRQPQGEYTILVAGTSPTNREFTEAELQAELTKLIHQGISRSQASRELAEITSLPKRQIYQIALTILAPGEE
ncbi:16S rRNA (cytidine(1402)-2'-O)-methyltransferase [Calothrix sp. 336/3]|uniref:16S rRNA (cytidine(1402)-2'-O)-methyltransferase n=1 Tax=Calothrix sp. 336/3 TaxID=1337936 RepID=UPI0004E3D46F|nr:16S rRNA (cytidine(1402)-2'-O)-methyltransferase [Calothrix sp. 336/3]AKG22980.1 16S rRNA methyltransferase [Calothrix sp. 336/3]